MKLARQAIPVSVSANLLYAAIFLKFAAAPGSVALFNQMSQAVHGFVSQPVFRLGSGMFETVVAVLLLIPKTARLGAGSIVVWMTAVLLSHIFVLGYGPFSFDALMVMLLAVVYLALTRRLGRWREPEIERAPHHSAHSEVYAPDKSIPGEEIMATPMTPARPPFPPFTRDSAIQRVRRAEDAWNTHDPGMVALAYAVDSRWRNRSEFITDEARSLLPYHTSGRRSWTTG
jgi:Protein of unknown function (DUF1348)